MRLCRQVKRSSALEHPARMCRSVALGWPQREQRPADILPHKRRLEGVESVSWIEFKKNFNLSSGMQWSWLCQLKHLHDARQLEPVAALCKRIHACEGLLFNNLFYLGRSTRPVVRSVVQLLARTV